MFITSDLGRREGKMKKGYLCLLSWKQRPVPLMHRHKRKQAHFCSCMSYKAQFEKMAANKCQALLSVEKKKIIVALVQPGAGRKRSLIFLTK